MPKRQRDCMSLEVVMMVMKAKGDVRVAKKRYWESFFGNPRKINEIVNCKRSISPAFAIALEEALGTTAPDVGSYAGRI